MVELAEQLSNADQVIANLENRIIRLEESLEPKFRGDSSAPSSECVSSCNGSKAQPSQVITSNVVTLKEEDNLKPAISTHWCSIKEVVNKRNLVVLGISERKKTCSVSKWLYSSK